MKLIEQSGCAGTDPQLIETVNWDTNRVGFTPADARSLEVGAGQTFVALERAVLPPPDACTVRQ